MWVNLIITRACNSVIARPCYVIKYAITTKSGIYKRVNILFPPPMGISQNVCIFAL